MPTEVTIEETGRAIGVLATLLIAVAVGVVVGYFIARLVGVLIRRIGRRHEVTATLTARSRRPMRIVMVLLGAMTGFSYGLLLKPGEDPPVWHAVVQHAFVIALILALAWLASSVANVAEESITERYYDDKMDSRKGQRVVTQAQMLRRIVVVAVWLLALATILMTFPGARTIGTSIFASAGIVSVVAGLAAQTTLANTFAGMQLAFTDGIRVGDVVIVAEEYGRVEEITLTYVIVRVWDDRRIVLPSTYFTTTPFENWTRRAADLLGSVEFDLDWRVPLGPMRTELTRLVEVTDLWDGRLANIQVVDALAGWVRVRATVSAKNASFLWDLQCYVREGLVEWLQSEATEALPRMRLAGAAPADLAAQLPALQVAETPPGTGRPAGPVGDGKSDGAVRPAPGRKPSTKEIPAVPVAGPVAPEPVGTPPLHPTRTSVWQRRSAGDIQQDASFYTGTSVGREIAESFSGPGEEAMEEREARAREAEDDVLEDDASEADPGDDETKGAR